MSAVSAGQKLAQLEAKHAHQLVELQLSCCTQAWRAEELRQRLEARAQHIKRAEEYHSSRTQELDTSAENRPRCDQDVQEGTRCSARKPDPAISSETVCERGRRSPGEDDEEEDPVMQGLRDDVARGLDDGWSQRSRTVPVETALVCLTLE